MRGPGSSPFTGLRAMGLTAWGLAALLSAGGPVTLGAQESHLVIVVGLGGDEAHRETFNAWAARLVEAAGGTLGLPAENIHFLGERPDEDPGGMTGRSSRDEVREVIDRIASTTPPRRAVDRHPARTWIPEGRRGQDQSSRPRFHRG